MRRCGVGAVLCLAMLGCSDHQRAPFIDLDGPSDGGAGPGGSKPDVVGNGSITDGDFASDGMYVFGSLTQGAAGLALARLSAPETFVVGFEGSALPTPFKSVNVWKNKLVYIPDGSQELPLYGLTQFVPDELGAEGKEYPVAPFENDIVLDETPACPASKDPNLGPQRFMVNPEGRMIYLCSDGWYEGDEYVLPASADVRAFGRGGLVDYPVNEFAAAIGSLGSEEVTLINLAVVPDARPYGGTFRAVGGREDGLLELLEFELDGNYKLLGSYPELPTGWDGVVLDEDDFLYAVYPDDGGFAVARATVGETGTGKGGKVDTVLSASTSSINPRYLFCPP